MPQPPWKQLVEDLKDQGYDSVYLDRLRARLDVEQHQAILEKEIIQEMAYALGQSAAKVDHALLQLELLERAIELETDSEKISELASEYDAKRQEALQLRRDLLIHREALGIRQNDCLERMYPVPDRGRLERVLGARRA